MTTETITIILNEWVLLLKDELPPTTSEYDHFEDIKVKMKDGTRLMTRVLFPAGEGPWPVILVRNPYSPVNSDSHMQQPIILLTMYGYIIVYQQVRGTFGSEGEWVPFENERTDGLDTVKWIIKQPWSNGNIGTFGGSYLGHVQWCIADSIPPEVKTMYFSVYGGKSYDTYYKNGMFKFGGWAFWAMEMMKPSRNLDIDPIETRKKSIDRFNQIKFTRPHIQIDQTLFNDHISWYRDWVSNPNPNDSYWTSGYWGTFQKAVEKIRIPIMFQGGWFDFFLDPMVETYLSLSENIRKKSRFIIGPWHHGNLCGGPLDYPNNNILGTGFIRDALEWFDHHLKGKNYAHRKGIVEAYVIGDGVWKTWDPWLQPNDYKDFFLKSNGSPSNLIGELVENPVEGDINLSYSYNPDNPVISRGGNLLTGYPNLENEPECSTVQDEPTSRNDVLTFISPKITENLHITGNIIVHLYVSSDAEDTSFTAKVMEVFPYGKAFNIQDGISTLILRNNSQHPTSYIPGKIVKIDLVLSPILWTAKKGSRIRLDISSSNFPAYHIHPNILGTWSRQKEIKTALQKIFIGASHPSSVQIPYV